MAEVRAAGGGSWEGWHPRGGELVCIGVFGTHDAAQQALLLCDLYEALHEGRGDDVARLQQQLDVGAAPPACRAAAAGCASAPCRCLIVAVAAQCDSCSRSSRCMCPPRGVVLSA